ncbi:MAG: ATP-binding protein [Gammaproteobacteria bacterium]|nr:ATP-binding protein [Gammaproteobacteria bacterium]
MDFKQKNEVLLNEQVHLLYAALPFSIVASLLNGCILVYVERSVISRHVLEIWLVCLIAVMVYRGVSYVMYKRTKFWPVNDVRWSYLNFTGVVLAAIVWGGASVFLFPSSSIEHQAFLGFVIAGMSAGAISTLSYSFLSIIIFLICILSPLAVQFFIEGNEFGFTMGSMIVIYFLVMISVAIKNYKNSCHNIMLRLQAEKQQKALKQSEEKYQTIFNSAPLGIFHYTPEGKITSQNNMALDLIEVDVEFLHRINLLTDIQDQEFVNAIKTSLHGELGQYKGSTKTIFPHSDKPIRMYCRGINDTAGGISGGVAVLEDITEDNRVEKLKNEFVSTVSHELRTPLTAIYGSSELLSNARDQIGEEQFNSLISNISRNSERLIFLVNDILDAEKIATGKMEFVFEQYEVCDLVSQAALDNQSYAEKHNVRFLLEECRQSAAVMVDKNRFLQVMANLLSNAAKFSPDGSDVKVGVSKNNDTIRVFVKDRGPGISPDFQTKIFEKFTQSDASDTRKVGGTGLGLTISKDIVEKMNGNLSFNTEVGEGTTFYFELPLVIQNIG